MMPNNETDELAMIHFGQLYSELDDCQKEIVDELFRLQSTEDDGE